MVTEADCKTINIQCKGADLLPLDAIEDFQGNLKRRNKSDIDKIIKSIERYGFSFPFFVWNGDGHNRCLDGHGRIQALAEMRRQGVSLPLFPVAYIEAVDEAEAKQKLLRLNSQYGQMTMDSVLEFADGVEVEWSELSLPDGVSMKIMESKSDSLEDNAKLSEAFIIPPFTILDTRQGYWQERKMIWRKLIGDNGETRESTLRKSKSGEDPSYYKNKTKIEKMLGMKISNQEYAEKYYQRDTSLPVGVSLLDPVLSEVVIHWFSIPNSKIFDCFAGDSVFGYVASYKGHNFTGIELRQDQVDINSERISEYKGSKYICDDGRNVGIYIEPESQDMLFSCPPYFDLEVYSDDEKDASNQKNYEDFLAIIETAFSNSIRCLKNNSFAVITVGDIRRKKDGAYYNFPGDVKSVFQKNGMILYNELILIDMIGNSAIRASGAMKQRKVVKTHQNVLVFYKGNSKEIANRYPKLDTNEAQDESTNIQL
jgi:DNA modification methylase